MPLPRISRTLLASTPAAIGLKTALAPVFAVALVFGIAATAAASGPRQDGLKRDGPFRIEFSTQYDAKFAPLDTAVERWMHGNGIHAAQLAFRRAGKLVFSHAYTYGPDKDYATVDTSNVMRLASVSKMMATAAVTTLYAQGTLQPNEPVFPLLGISKPLFANQKPSRYIDDVTVDELVQHSGGFHGEGAGDPLFTMRDVEVRLGREPLTKDQFARYVYGLPLQFKPGSQTLYSNVGYLLLGMVVEKATGMSFYDYMNGVIFPPLGLTNVTLGSTSFVARNPAEVIPDDPYYGPSVFDLTKGAPSDPFDYEGGDIIWEDADSASDFETNAESVSRFIHTYNVYGTGGRAADYARSGCVPGVATWAESLDNGVDFALLFNKQPCLDFSSHVIVELRARLTAL
jgi:CubicO group peptidase (beta-lactamase class C family)